jgi:hypothetical protein
MHKELPLVALALALSACAHHGQPRARCAGPLERINVPTQENVAEPAPMRPEAPKDEEGKP